MYSPKIPERLIPELYRLGRARGRPMTQLVAEAIERYLASERPIPNGRPDEISATACRPARSSQIAA